MHEWLINFYFVFLITVWWGAGVVICLERGADLHMAQLMPLPLTVSCFSKIQSGFTFLVPAHLGSPGQRAVKWMCVCVCVFWLQTSPVVFRLELLMQWRTCQRFVSHSTWFCSDDVCTRETISICDVHWEKSLFASNCLQMTHYWHCPQSMRAGSM